MGHTTGHLCSRVSMYPPSLVAVEEEEPHFDSMTGLQEQDAEPALAKERRSKQVRWQSLDLKADQSLPVTSAAGNGRSWSEQQDEIPIVSPRHRPRVEATASPIFISPTPASTKPSSRSSTHHDAPNSQKRSRRRSTRNNKSSSMGRQDMHVLPESAYVPPHLRNRTALATTVEEIAATLATKDSSTMSTKSRTGRAGKAHSSLNGASRISNQTPSLATTPQEPQLQVAEAQTGTGQDQGTPSVARVDTPLKTTEPENGGCIAWDVPVPDPPSVAPKRGNPRWSRTKEPHKKTVWPKQRDMKAMPSDSSSGGGISFKSNSNGDPNYDVRKLMDWNGDWLPPPEEWSARKGHTNRHFGRAIEQWIDGHPESCLEKMDTSLPAFSNDKDCKEVAPRYWVVSTIERGSLGEFWKGMPMRQPSALSDISVRPPFWERYEEEPSYFIDGLVVPDVRVDPSDLENHRAGADLLTCATGRVESIMQQRLNVQRRALAKQRRPIRESIPTAPQLPDRRILPRSNIYFRPVGPKDLEGIAKIYNYYVENTIFANEFDARTEEQIENRVDAIVKAGLPYLVAIARNNQRKGDKSFAKETVVGYASLDDYCDQSSMYRYTFELELYVHPGYTCQNVASCLLDRILEMANTGYNACGGYEYRNDSEYLKTGPARVIKTIMVTVHKEHGQSEDATMEYMKRFKFYRAGHIPQMGFKLGKAVDVFLYRHTTTETVDPNTRPTVPLERD